jgi:hypothetical protein
VTLAYVGRSVAVMPNSKLAINRVKTNARTTPTVTPIKIIPAPCFITRPSTSIAAAPAPGKVHPPSIAHPQRAAPDRFR